MFDFPGPLHFYSTKIGSNMDSITLCKHLKTTVVVPNKFDLDTSKWFSGPTQAWILLSAVKS